MNKLEYKTYGTSKYWLNEGYYTLQELEELVARIKQADSKMDAHLLKSLQSLKDK